MKIKDVLNESVTDVVARFYIEASETYDKFYNPEDVKYKNKTNDYYNEYFKGWFNEGQVPVFTKPVTKPQPEYTNVPKAGKIQSAGYRGKQIALAAAGLPYDHQVQRYEPNIANIVAPSTGVATRNNNGN